jgi:hypothetical protein
MQLRQVLAALQRVVTRDEGGRGIAPLLLPHDLARSAAQLLSARSVGIVTGFPCLITEDGTVRFDSPQETDGPAGAVAIAQAVLALGHDACVLTDEANGGVLNHRRSRHLHIFMRLCIFHY